MISGICSLFNARPVYHGDTKTIDIVSIYNSTGWMEILLGKNMDKIQRQANSNNIITRLYVEGEYGDNGYVGIDNENPTGLPFILNFDYYKERGAFTDYHQSIVDQYLIDYKAAIDLVSQSTASILEKHGELNDLIGSYGYAYYPVLSGVIDDQDVILGNSISPEESEMNDGDIVAVISNDGSYVYESYPSMNISSETIAVIKFVPTITGLLAAYEDAEEASAGNTETYLEKLNSYLIRDGYNAMTVDDLKEAYGTNDLSIVKNKSFDISRVTDERCLMGTTLDYSVSIGEEEKKEADIAEKKRVAILNVVALIIDINSLTGAITNATSDQVEIEESFNIKMGSMLRDGYWSDNNYTVGQESSLYNDALAISKKMAFPIATYNVGVQNLSRISKYKDEEFDIAQTVRMYDPIMKINDYGLVSRMTDHADSPLSDTLEITNDVLNVGNKTFASILERVTEMAEKVRQGKEIYERAAAISKDGTINSTLLEGAIDVLRTRLLSSASNWYTDDNGNIIMESLDGTSAMMLSGNGFMCANTKTSTGAWNWRTFGTGNGFTADMIITGYLNAERIEAGSIGVNLLAPNIGTDIDIRDNQAVADISTRIELAEGQISLIVEGDETSTGIALTEDMIAAVANAIEIDANDRFSVAVGELDSISSIASTADKIHLLIESKEGTSSFELTPEAVDVISKSITLTADQIALIAKLIDLNSNESVRLMVSKKNATFYRNERPIEYASGDTWISPANGKAHIAVGMTGINAPYIAIDDELNLMYYFDENANTYSLAMDGEGNLMVSYGEDVVVEDEAMLAEISGDGELVAITGWVSLKLSELRTSYIDIGENYITLSSGSNITINAGANLDVDAGAAHFRTNEYTLSILTDEEGSEDTVMDFDADGRTLRVSEIEAGNIRPFVFGITEVTSAEIGGLDGLRGMLESAQYEHVIYTQSTDDLSAETVTFAGISSLRVDIVGNAEQPVRMPPVAFTGIVGNININNVSWSTTDTAVNADSGSVVFEDCYIDAGTGLSASRHARMIWIGSDDEAVIEAGVCTQFAYATEGAEIRMYGLIPSGTRSATRGGSTIETNIRISTGGTSANEYVTKTLAASVGYYGTKNGWNADQLYQGYSDGKGVIYGCISFDELPPVGTHIQSALLGLHRYKNAGKGSAVHVSVYGSATDFGNHPTLGNEPYISRENAAAPGATISLDVTGAINEMVNNNIKQLVFYTNETNAMSGKVYSSQYALFDKCALKITYQGG